MQYTSPLAQQYSGADVLLLSGGVESATLLHTLKERRPRSLFIDYGQRAAARERLAAQRQCEVLQQPLTCLELSSLGDTFRAGQERKLHVPVPHRNLMALSLGLSYLEQQGGGRLYLALNHEDTETYSSAGREFVEQFGKLAQLLGNMQLLTPFIDKSKADIVCLGHSLGVDYGQTYSCLLGYEQHCGACPQCHKRQAAFAAAGVEEAADFYRGIIEIAP